MHEVVQLSLKSHIKTAQVLVTSSVFNRSLRVDKHRFNNIIIIFH